MKLNKDNTCLFYVIENKENLIIETQRSLYHIKESNSWIKDIRIFLVTPTELTIDTSTKNSFLEIIPNIIFIEEECVLHTDHVFFNMIYGCSLAERYLQKNYPKFEQCIYLDCDMYLIKDFPEIFPNTDIVLESEGYYNEETDNWLKNKNKWLNILKIKQDDKFTYINTEFMITKIKNNIFQQWEDTFNNIYPKLKKFEKTFKKVNSKTKFDISCMEETSFEILINKIQKNVKVLFLPDVVARLGNPSAIPENKNNVLFLSQHISEIDEILFDYNNVKNIQNTITLELIYSCEFDCFFCEKPNLEKPIIIPKDKLKYHLDQLYKSGITTVDLTPTKGDIFNIPNLVEYLEIIENSNMHNFYFYTSLAVSYDIQKENTENIKKLINFINNSSKVFIHFSCYFNNDYNDFKKIVRKDKHLYNLNISNSLYFIKNINNDKIEFIDRVNKFNGVPEKLKIKKILDTNKVAKLANYKKIPIICEDDDLKETRNLKLRHTAFCEQFSCCSTLKMNGDIVYCNYSKAYYNGKVEHIDTFENKLLLNKDLINNDICKNCLYKMESGVDELIWDMKTYSNNYKKETKC
jgi:hypothetical protein